jgi:hypothetical protein
MNPSIIRTVVLGSVLFSGCSLSSPTDLPVQVVGTGSHLLWIGNSYLYYNDIPAMMQTLADSAKGERVAIAVVAGPNLALVDHRNSGVAGAAITNGDWKWVILQQGPSSVEANRDTLRAMTQFFSTEIKKAGGTPALFSAWPTSDRLQDFDRAIESYSIAANDVGGILLPVAAAWKLAMQRDAALKLYDDGLHPSIDGAYLSALVVYSRLLGKDPRGLPKTFRLRTGRTVVINAATGTTLQSIAAEVNGYK